MGTHYQGTTAERRALNTLIKLTRCADAVMARLAGPLKRDGLTASQFGVLEALLHLGPLHQNELCAKLLKSGGNLTVVITNLEQRGLVRRRRDGSDRRYVRVELTNAGRRLIRRVFPRHLAVVTGELAALTAAEQLQLAGLCKKLGEREESAGR